MNNGDAAELAKMADDVRRRARGLGFDLVGIAPATPSAYAEHFARWLALGRHGEMAYMARRVNERVNPAEYLPGVRSVICLGLNYHTPLRPPPSDRLAGRVARYALGDDYHQLVKPRLYALADWLRDATGCRTRCGVDSAPIMERELAERAGVGWIGKNTCIIHPDMGSYILLGEVLTTLDLPPDVPMSDHCGTCTRCIDACPTGAIVAPWELDARRCISYLTIEHAGDIDATLQRQMGDWLFGCDICQEVCPFNRDAPQTQEATLAPRRADAAYDTAAVLAWGWTTITRPSAEVRSGASSCRCFSVTPGSWPTISAARPHPALTAATARGGSRTAYWPRRSARESARA